MSEMTIKRIRADLREMNTDPSPSYTAAPVQDNLFEWHFTIKGPRETEFEGGIYHGRIILPSEYPFKPPNIILLTPNGRFEVNKKICLSISSHHPETWLPAWGIRLILEALIAFMPTKGEGALGALDYSAEERRRLAVKSHEYVCPICGPIKGALDKDAEATGAPSEAISKRYTAEIAKMHLHTLEATPAKQPRPAEVPEQAAQPAVAADAEMVTQTPIEASLSRDGSQADNGLRQRATAAPAMSPQNTLQGHSTLVGTAVAAPKARDTTDQILSVIMYVLIAIILFVVWRTWSKMKPEKYFGS